MTLKRKMFFKGFWPKVHNICIAGFLKMVNLFYNFYRLLENIQ